MNWCDDRMMIMKRRFLIVEDVEEMRLMMEQLIG